MFGVGANAVVGVDLGGTNVRAQVFAENGDAKGDRIEIESLAQNGIEACLDAVADAIEAAVKASSSRPTAVGIAIPGHIDDESGYVRWAPNFGIEIDGVFHYWEDVSFRGPLSKRVTLRIHMGNDANLAALGEYKFGSGKNSAKCLVMITVGTGIGGGVVLSPSAVQGKAGGPLLLVGGNKGGGELGHTIIQMEGLDSTAGAFGTIEAYCNRDAIIHRTQNRLNRGVDSCILKLAGNDIAGVTPQVIGLAADQGDDLALQIWREFGAFLGTGLGSIINIFAPDAVAVGGQIAKSWPHFRESLLIAARDTAIPSLWKDCSVQQATQIEDAGLLGAAALAFESERH